MTDLLTITPEPPGTNVVHLLEELLLIARAGGLSSVAVAGVKRDGSVLGEWTFMPSAPALLGAVSRLQHRMHLTVDGD